MPPSSAATRHKSRLPEGPGGQSIRTVSGQREGSTEVQPMMQRLIRGMQRALGLHHPGRNLEVWPDDVFILSFPKSGNTWTRFLIANLVYPETPVDFSNINRLTPDPEALSKRGMARMPRPRIIKSHQYFDPRYKRVIYVVRDPRDVALSQFHFHRKRGLIEDGYPPEKFVARFVAGETSPYG